MAVVSSALDLCILFGNGRTMTFVKGRYSSQESPLCTRIMRYTSNW